MFSILVGRLPWLETGSPQVDWLETGPLHSGIGQIIATFSTLKFAVYTMSNPLPPEVEEMEMATQSSSAGVAFVQVA